MKICTNAKNEKKKEFFVVYSLFFGENSSNFKRKNLSQFYLSYRRRTYFVPQIPSSLFQLLHLCVANMLIRRTTKIRRIS
jgi:hypothetical protein